MRSSRFLQVDMFGANSKLDSLGWYTFSRQRTLNLFGQWHNCPLDFDLIAAFRLNKLCIKKVHLRRTDETSHKNVDGVFKNLLRRANLLDKAILHDDNTVTQGHGFGLIVGNIYEGCIDTLAQLNNFSAHLVTQFGVQI